MQRATSVIAGLAVVALALPAQSQDMYAINLGGAIFEVNSITGVASQVGPSGFNQTSSMASTPWGTIYVISGGNNLITIDRNTGVGTLVGAVTMLDVRALAYDKPSGLLYAIRDNTVSGSGGDRLWTIDPATLGKQLVGDTTREGINGLAFHPNGQLYGWDVGDGGGQGPGLTLIDKATAATTTVNPGLNNGFNYEFLTIKENGICYVGSDIFCSVNIFTGVESFISNFPNGQLMRGCDMRFDPGNTLGANYCVANANSTGQISRIIATGSALASNNNLSLRAIDLPQNQFGYFLVSGQQGFVPFTGGSQGNLCLNLPVGRFNLQIVNSQTLGTFAIQVDTTALPLSPPTPIQSGDTWNFQCWYRDNNPGPTSNFSNGVSITFI
jgi:hypothetical protein